ncbi:MAG: hypothetical protein PUC29_04810 [Clostridia bacterium]|nr:hypothetical protein [Clostridia bacterium]
MTLWLGSVFLIHSVPNIESHIFGYILFAAALSGMARLEDDLKEAKKGFIILAAITAVKAVLWNIFPSLSDATVTRLLYEFSFAVAEAVFFLPAMSKLLSGLGYFVSRHSGAELTADPLKLRGITSASFIVSAAASVLPFVPTLSGDGGSYVYGASESVWSQFTDLFYVFGTIAAYIVSFIWLFKFDKMIRKLFSDTVLMDALSEKYEKEVLAFPQRLAAERLKTVLLLFSVACGFTLNLYIDHVNILPNFIAAVLLAAGTVLLREASAKLRAAGVAAAACWAVLSYVGLRLQRAFVAEGYSPERALHGIGKSAEMYAKIEYFSFAEALFFGAAAVIFALCLAKTVRVHINSKERFAALRVPLRRSMIPVYVALAFTVIMNLLQTPLMKYYPPVWMISALISMLLTVAAYRMYVSITDNLCHRMSL